MKKRRKLSGFLMALLFSVTALWSLSGYAAQNIFINQNGVEMTALKCERSDTGDAPFVTLYVRVVNNTERKLWIACNDAAINGIPVSGTGRGVDPYSDTGADEPKYYSFMGSEEDGGAGYEAIRNARTLDVTIAVQDYASYEHLWEQRVSIDLSSLAEAEAPTSSSSSSSSSYGTSSRNTAPAYTPASTNYQALEQGSSGQAVRDLQQRLTDLGYLNDKVDGVFGQNTATAVLSFCDQHNIHFNGAATPEMQRKLYSSGAEYYVEPYIPLIIGPWYKWDNPMDARQDIGMFYVQLVNRNMERSIRGYELYYYQTDVWGEKLKVPGSDAWLYPLSSQQTIKPGYWEYATPFTVTPFAQTYAVYVGVHKIVFEDGEIREIPDDEVHYYECPVKN